MKGRSKSSKQKQELFLSHSSKDRDFVVRLVRVLKQHGVRYWYSAAHISGAKQWHDEIGRAPGSMRLVPRGADAKLRAIAVGEA